MTMRTTTYAEKFNAKTIAYNALVKLNAELEVARKAKRDAKANGETEGAVFTTYTVVKDAQKAAYGQLVDLNAELKAMRTSGTAFEKGESKQRGRKPAKPVEPHNLAELKAILETSGVEFKNKGIMLDIAGKHVTFAAGRFVVDKVKFGPAEIMGALK
jgi:hypothetical protein